MLAQILPGFRDFRTPLMTGVLWLTAIWVFLGTPIPKKDDKEGIFGLLNQVSEYLSPALILGVLSFTAYLLGVLLMPNMQRKLNRGAARVHWVRMKTSVYYRDESKPRLFRCLIRRANLHRRQPDYPLRGGHTRKSQDLLHEVASDAVYTAGKKELDLFPLKYHYDWISPAEDHDNDIPALSDRVTKDLMEEAASIAAALQAGNERVFNNYDRARSEAEFRFSIHMPLFFIAAGIAWNFWKTDNILALLIGAAGAAVSTVLFVKGIHKMNEATEIGSEAIKAGVVPSKALDRVPGWNKKDEAKPQPTSEPAGPSLYARIKAKAKL